MSTTTAVAWGLALPDLLLIVAALIAVAALSYGLRQWWKVGPLIGALAMALAMLLLVIVVVALAEHGALH